MYSFAQSAATERDQENCAFSPRMRREETDYVIVVKRETGASELLCVGSEVQLAAENSGFELRGAVSSISITLKNLLQIGQEKNINSSIGRQLLFQPEITCLVAKL